MTGRLLTLKAIPAGLLIVLCTFSVRVHALFNECQVTSGNVLNLRNINLTTDEFSPGTVIYTTSQNVGFDCHISIVKPSNTRPKLVLSYGYFGDFSRTLDNMGLGFQLTITEDGTSPVVFSWDEIKAIKNGNELRKDFGNILPLGKPVSRMATLKLDFLYTKAYTSNSAVTAFPGAGGNVLNIVPLPETPRANGINLSPFNVRILRRGLGKVDIMPSLVSLGHFYTTYEPSQSKQASFTVTARQVLRPAAGQEFTLPLSVTFGKGALSADASNQALNLVNLDGNANGLRLSIKDNTGRQITFDDKEKMGDININSQLSGSVSKIYTAEVTPVPGGTVRTGKFSAAIPVTVTYD
ncbi:hypothetical protein JHS31_002422 [Salmonella enterica]|nr:hypothetical protein [Salmonella enterica]